MSKCLVFFAEKINNGEFEKEAKEFAHCHKIPPADVIPIETRQEFFVMRIKVMRELRARKGQNYDAVVFMCHGWPKKLQLGFKMASVPALARRIAWMSTDKVTVVLYACSAATDDQNKPDACGMAEEGGFAHELRDGFEGLGKESVDIYGHTTSGHLTFNPHVVVHFLYGYSDVGKNVNPAKGACYIAKPFSMYWQNWRKHLLKDKDFRFRFPFMDCEQIRSELV